MIKSDLLNVFLEAHDSETKEEMIKYINNHLEFLDEENLQLFEYVIFEFLEKQRGDQ